jgi:lipopolysaccharide/colanic/teichoic acid biosynthesis glycosyltransferase
MKRLFDILSSLVAIVVLLPILIIVGVFVYLQDGGSCIFGQQRVGKDGQIFQMWKFRSMVINAENLGGYSTADRDPRITPFGQLIRRTSLDELPQLFNVLFGDMSVVGPRPDVPAQRNLYTNEEWTKRHSVRPGITGLAQATLRSEATVEQRKLLDLEYVNSISLVRDFQIILMTINQVIFKGGN